MVTENLMLLKVDAGLDNTNRTSLYYVLYVFVLYYVLIQIILRGCTAVLYHGTAVLRVRLRRPHTHTHGRCANRQTGGLRKPRITKDLLLLSSRIASVFASRHKQTLWPSIRIPPLESLKPKHAEIFFVHVTRPKQQTTSRWKQGKCFNCKRPVASTGGTRFVDFHVDVPKFGVANYKGTANLKVVEPVLCSAPPSHGCLHLRCKSLRVRRKCCSCRDVSGCVYCEWWWVMPVACM